MTTTIADQRRELAVMRRTFTVSSAAQLIGYLVKDDVPYKHNDPRLSDCERGNAAAHLRATLLGHGVTVAVLDGELVLAGMQAIFLAEWDGPRPRQMHVQTMGM